MSSHINFIDNHIEQGFNRLITQYKQKPNVEGLISSLVLPLQSLEDSIKFYFENHSIFDATGIHLDSWGTVLVEPRFGLNDSDYRIQLLAKVAQNFSEGTAEDLISMFKTLTRAAYIVYSEIYPAEVSITAVDVDLIGDSARIRSVLDLAKAAGVRITSAIVTAANVFSFDADADPNSKGFGDLNDLSLGGEWASII